MISSQDNAIVIRDTSANPGPLGLFGFGMTTVLLNIHNAGFYELNSMIVAMGMFYGGLAQVVAGILESKKNNTFGMTAFISYGFFWLTLVALIFVGKWGWVPATSKSALATYLLVWGVFTLLLFFGTFKATRALQFVFATLTVLFFLLAIGNYTESEAIIKIAGFEGIVCGGAAIYTGTAGLLAEVYGRQVLPV